MSATPQVFLHRRAESLVTGFSSLSPDADFLRDAALVCRGNEVVHWSAALLGQFSDLVKTYLSSNPVLAASHPLTLLLPEVGAVAVRKVLTWSTRGEVMVAGRRELAEVRAALRGLRVDGDFNRDDGEELEEDGDVAEDEDVQDVVVLEHPNPLSMATEEKHTKSRGGKARKAKSRSVESEVEPDPTDTDEPLATDKAVKVKRPSLTARNSPIKPNLRQAPGKPKDSDRTPRPRSKKLSAKTDFSKEKKGCNNNNTVGTGSRSGVVNWSCMFCPVGGTSYSALVYHLSKRHYQDKILRFWEGEDLTEPCPLCKKVLFGGLEKPSLEEQREELSGHLGRKHGKILAVCEEDVRVALRKIKDKLLPEDMERADAIGRECKRLFPDCLNCTLDLPPGEDELRAHLAHVHFHDRLVDRFGGDGDGDTCRVCSREMKRTSWGRYYDAVHHMLLHHKDVLDEVFPAKIVDLINGKSDVDDVEVVPAELPGSPPKAKAQKIQITPMSKSHPKLCPVNDARILKLQKRRLSNDDSKHVLDEGKKRKKPADKVGESPAKKKSKTVSFAIDQTNDAKPAKPFYAGFPFVCAICGRSVTRLNTLERHLSRMHFHEEIFKLEGITPGDVRRCKVCKSERPASKNFKEMEKNMAEHLGAVHKRLYKVVPESVMAGLVKMGYKREEFGSKTGKAVQECDRGKSGNDEEEDAEIVPKQGGAVTAVGDCENEAFVDVENVDCTSPLRKKTRLEASPRKRISADANRKVHIKEEVREEDDGGGFDLT